MNGNKYNHSYIATLTGCAVIGISFLGYLLTMSPTVYLGDSGEFIASAFCLGNAHNSGYPLYALAGKIFAMIPLGHVAFRLNVMSACFGALTVWLTYIIILKMTESVIPAFSASLLLAFSSTLWSQTACAEVYTLHAFFVALIVLLLFRWHETRSFNRLMVFALVVGLSFTNHMQTTMLAPAVIMFIIWSDTKVLWNIKHFFLLSFFFVLALSVYLYLPIRTEAGAAIHCGDPNTIGNFLAHVTASSHRQSFVFAGSWSTYKARFVGAMTEMAGQYYLFLILALMGWVKQRKIAYKIFWALIILFDTIYTVFLNTVSLEITTFQVSSSVVLAILIGQGLAWALKYRANKASNNAWKRWLKPAFACFPVILLSTNIYKNDQHMNYTAYEYGTNILRSVPVCATLLPDTDNTTFPVAYLKLVENARPDLVIYDRRNFIFKMPFLCKGAPAFFGKWEESRKSVGEELIKQRDHVYIAMFGERLVRLRNFQTIPVGVTYRAVAADRLDAIMPEEIINPWPYYMFESMLGSFYRDYMNRSVTGYFFLKMGRDLLSIGRQSAAIQTLNRASSVAYNDEYIHMELAIFYTDMAMYQKALAELKSVSQFATNLPSLWNTWGYYYYKAGRIAEALEAFKQSVATGSKYFAVYNNLGLIYLEIGKFQEARKAFTESLSINPDQPKLVTLMKTKGLR